ncbi:MAG: hypothetical protein ACYTGE_18645, partial [Planctomycetota bacterium]
VMKIKDIKAINAEVPPFRRTFHYFKDRFALMLLSYVVGKGKAIRLLKQTPFAGLLRKPLVKRVCAGLGGGRLTPHALASAWPDEAEAFGLSISAWGTYGKWEPWLQTSRPGFNLVLHLNLTGPRCRECREAFNASGVDEWCDHPWTKESFTLAWARLDIDRKSGEALIEEVQSDWGDDMQDSPLAPYARLWDEAMLTAAVRFLRDDVGVHRIYYHTFEGGLRYKRFDPDGYCPPRSLYTALPRRFCFELTDQPPRFLRHCDNRRVRKSVRRNRLPWQLLRV